MKKSVSYGRAEESAEAKARWYQSLPMAERLEVFCSFCDLILSVNPGIVDRKNAEQARKGVRILSLSDLPEDRAPTGGKPGRERE